LSALGIYETDSHGVPLSDPISPIFSLAAYDPGSR
jgi:hypothetical protein